MFYESEVESRLAKLFLLVFIHEMISVCGTYKHITNKVPALKSLQSNSKK